MKKLSELMLEGYSMVGKQCTGVTSIGDPRNPMAVCAVGAASLAKFKDANDDLDAALYCQIANFKDRVGCSVMYLNDNGMSIPDIAGIAAAEGL